MKDIRKFTIVITEMLREHDFGRSHKPMTVIEMVREHLYGAIEIPGHVLPTEIIADTVKHLMLKPDSYLTPTVALLGNLLSPAHDMTPYPYGNNYLHDSQGVITHKIREKKNSEDVQC